jgi:hypothetical protein
MESWSHTGVSERQTALIPVVDGCCLAGLRDNHSGRRALQSLGFCHEIRFHVFHRKEPTSRFIALHLLNHWIQRPIPVVGGFRSTRRCFRACRSDSTQFQLRYIQRGSVARAKVSLAIRRHGVVVVVGGGVGKDETMARRRLSGCQDVRMSGCQDVRKNTGCVNNDKVLSRESVSRKSHGLGKS